MSDPTSCQYEDADPAEAARALREAVAELDEAYEKLASVHPYKARRWAEFGRPFFLGLALRTRDAEALWTYTADLRTLLVQCRRVIEQMEAGT